MKRYALIAVLLTLPACSYLPDWMGGGEEDKPRLQGERVAVLADAGALKADESLQDTTLNLPPAEGGDSWTQAGGNAASWPGHPVLAEKPEPRERARIGGGNEWEEKRFSAPVIGGQMLYAMDAKGFISSHLASDVSRVYWVSSAATQENEGDVLGGGLVLDGGRLFVTTGRGKVMALSLETGQAIWSQNLSVPLRAAPKAADGRLVVLTADNQTFGLSQDTGETLWSHRGIGETAEYMSETAPALQDGIAVVPYSSGMLAGLDLASGKEIWNDSLALARRTAASSIFSGIGGSPVIADGFVYAVSNNGLLASSTLGNGRRAWDLELSSNQTPVVAGDYIFALSTGNVLAAIARADGRTKWVQALPRYENEAKRKNPIVWHGPVLAGGRLWLAGTHGQLWGLDPQNGMALADIDIPENVIASPVIAGGVMYLITSDATLHALK